jgi:hypothetical protein
VTTEALEHDKYQVAINLYREIEEVKDDAVKLHAAFDMLVRYLVNEFTIDYSDESLLSVKDAMFNAITQKDNILARTYPLTETGFSVAIMKMVVYSIPVRLSMVTEYSTFCNHYSKLILNSMQKFKYA